MVERLNIAASRAQMPITVRVREACRLTGVGRSKLYELIKTGEISVIKVGTITLIPVDSLKRYLGIELGR